MSTYRLLNLIGAGGMGEVYEALRVLPNGDQSLVACKSMRADLHDRPEYLRFFFREAKINLEISHNHAGLVTVHDCIEDQDGRSHLIMELIEGSNLEDVFAVFGRPSWDVVRFVAAEVFDALAYVHECGVMHRDISPCNVLLSSRGCVKISDLGLAKLVTAGKSDPRRFRGKWPYAAPEAVRGDAIDTRSDLFSVAAMLYGCITQRTIYGAAESIADVIAMGDDWRAPELPDEVPLDLRALISGLLRSRPSDRRPQTARNALALLWPFDHERARAQLADRATRIHERERDKRERLADGQGRILEVSQHIAHADTIANQSQAEGSESASTKEAVLPERRRVPRRKRKIAYALALATLGWFGAERYQGDGEHASDAPGEIAHLALEAPAQSEPDRQTVPDDRAPVAAPAPVEDPAELAPRDSIGRPAVRTTTRKARPVRSPIHSTWIARPEDSQTTAPDDWVVLADTVVIPPRTCD